MAELPPAHVVDQNVAFELSERSHIVKYPVVHVYVDRESRRPTTLPEAFVAALQALVPVSGA